jgi:hypothetical protein
LATHPRERSIRPPGLTVQPPERPAGGREGPTHQHEESTRRGVDTRGNRPAQQHDASNRQQQHPLARTDDQPACPNSRHTRKRADSAAHRAQSTTARANSPTKRAHDCPRRRHAGRIGQRTNTTHRTDSSNAHSRAQTTNRPARRADTRKESASSPTQPVESTATTPTCARVADWAAGSVDTREKWVGSSARSVRSTAASGNSSAGTDNWAAESAGAVAGRASRGHRTTDRQRQGSTRRNDPLLTGS